MPILDPDRCRRLLALFGRCLELDPAAREALLQAQAGDDPELCAQLRRMLAADAAAGLLDGGVVDLVSLEDGVAASHADDASPLDSHVGPWRLDRVLGRGGMGTVYAAHRDAPDSAQRAAVKRLHRRWDGSVQAERFLQEHRILAVLSHPHLARLIDHGVDDDGRPWFALEYIDGEPLTAWADQQRLGLHARIDLFRQVCAAVQHAHEHFVVHRDLKPANILVDAEGHPKVLDFGVAKRTDDAIGATHTGLMVGFTPEYAAPEQVTGGVISAATDVYALGVILYELLCGQLPYRVDHQNLVAATEAITSHTALQLEKALTTGSGDEVAARLSNRDTDLRAFRTFVRGDLSRIMQTALAKEPERRYQSVRLFAEDLKRLLAGRTVSVSGDTARYRIGKFVRRNPWAVAMASLAFMVLVGGSLALAWQAERTRREAELAIRMKDYLIEMIRQSDLQSGRTPTGARRALDSVADRLQTLPVDSATRLELLTVLLELYSERNLPHAGLAVATRELRPPPRWHGNATDALRLRAWVQLARLTKEIGEARSARAMLGRALLDYPNRGDVASAEAMQVIGEAWGDAGNSETAIRWHRDAISVFERHLEAGDHRLLLSRVLAAGGLTSLRRSREARAMTERVLADLPSGDSQRAAYFMNMAALRRALHGEFESAHALMLRSRNMLQRLGYARLRGYFVATRANNALALGRLAEARRDLDPQIREERATSGRHNELDLAELLLLRGEVSLAEGNPSGAAADFAAATEVLRHKHAGSSEMLYARALHSIALAEAGRLGEARSALPTASKRSPDYATVMAHAAAGRVFDLETNHAAANQAFERALSNLSEARTRPMIVHNQLREQRDEFRILGWQAAAVHRSGDIAQARRLHAAAIARALHALGPQHPFVRELQQTPGNKGEAGDDSAIARSDR